MASAQEREGRLTEARDNLVRATRRLDVLRRRARQARQQSAPMSSVLEELDACLGEVDGALTAIDKLIADVR